MIYRNAFGHKILGYPVSIKDSKKYQRNQLIFNLCFVFSDISRTTQYEPIIQKLARYLIDLEGEMGFISANANDGESNLLTNSLNNIKEQLNNEGLCILSICM